MTERFPLFVDLHGRRAVIVGGGAVAARRVKVLLSFGAEVTVIAPRLHPAIDPVRVTYEARCYQEGDLTGAFLAVAATDDRSVNAAVGGEADRRGIPVSLADCPEKSSFWFPAVCRGGGVIAGVSSGGEDPARTRDAAAAIRHLLAED